MAAGAQKSKTKSVKVTAVPCIDHNSRTCIEFERIGNEVRFITLSIDPSFSVKTLSASEFDRRYKPIPNYPIARACDLFIAYARKIGATQDVLNYLGKYVTISTTERSEIMATANKRAATSASKTDEAPAKKGKVSTKAKTQVVGRTKPTKAAKEAGAPRESASAMFQELIMKGTMTDDQIFKKIQEKFGLDDNKRSYVTWYRNKLKKDGKNPPDAK